MRARGVRRLLTTLAALVLLVAVGGPAAAASGPRLPDDLTRILVALRPGVHTDAGPALRLPEGSFVRLSGHDYEIVGGAPLYVSDWRAVGGRHPSRTVTEEQFRSLARYPRDGTFVRASDGAVYRYVAGAPIYVPSWAVLGGRRPALPVDARTIARSGEGDPWPLVDATVDLDLEHYFSTDGDDEQHPAPLSLDGQVFLRAAQTGRVYKMVGGAPLYLSSWDPVGGPKPAWTVDQRVIDRAGGPGPWRFVARRPPDIWVLHGTRTGQVYQVTGGAPLYVSTPAALTHEFFDGYFRFIPSRVDQAVIDRAGEAAPYDHLRYHPVDGTTLFGVPYADPGGPGGHFYRVENGAPVLLPEQADPGPDPQWVDQPTIDRAGEPGAWSHLRAPV